MKILFAPDSTAGVMDPPPSSTTSTPATGGDMKFFDAFDSDLGGDSRPGPAPDKPEPKPDAPAPATVPDKPAPDKAPVPDKPAPAPEPAAKTGKGQDGIKQLREAHEKALAEAKSERESKLKLEAQIQDYEKRGKDTEKLVERLAAKEKRESELESELRGLRQELSPEFKAKWDAPFNQAASRAKEIVDSLLIEEKDEDGNVTGQRKADWEKDFVRIFHLPKGTALREARKVFGEDSQVVISRMDKLWDAAAAREAAAQEEKANWKANEEARQAKEIAERGTVEQLWAQANQQVAEKEPDWFGTDHLQDPKEKEILSKGFSAVDTRHNQQLPLPQRVQLDAQIRHRAAAFGLARHRLGIAQTRIKELETALAEAKGGRPGAGTGRSGAGGGGGEAPTESRGVLDDFDKEVTGR